MGLVCKFGFFPSKKSLKPKFCICCFFVYTKIMQGDPAAFPQEGVKKGKFRKAILIVGGLFLFIILVEAGYFVYTKYFKSISTTSVPEGERAIDIGGTRTRPPTVDTLLNTIYSEKLDEFKEKFLSDFETGFFANSFITTTLVGDVVFANEYDDEEGNKNFAMSIENEGNQNAKIIWDDKEIVGLKAYVVDSRGVKEEVSYNDIREGDSVIIKYVVNLLDEEGHNTTTIEIRRF